MFAIFNNHFQNLTESIIMSSNDLVYDMYKKKKQFFSDDLAVITLNMNFVDKGHQNILPICQPNMDFDYTDYTTQLTIIGMLYQFNQNIEMYRYLFCAGCSHFSLA